jgi:hypothetical protein
MKQHAHRLIGAAIFDGHYCCSIRHSSFVIRLSFKVSSWKKPSPSESVRAWICLIASDQGGGCGTGDQDQVEPYWCKVASLWPKSHQQVNG